MGEFIWLLPHDAIRVIGEARVSGSELLGLDGAFIGASSTQPSLEDSWDYTSGSFPAVSDRYAHAIQFISDRIAKGLHFEIVLVQVSRIEGNLGT